MCKRIDETGGESSGNASPSLIDTPSLSSLLSLIYSLTETIFSVCLGVKKSTVFFFFNIVYVCMYVCSR